jgi:hypothetical protein
MNIHELDSYNLGDAVKFNDKLNPRIWGANEQMLPEVREQLLRIADDFREFLGISNLEVKDITVSGSNAAYTYTPHSDIDLHLVVDLPEADANEVYRELFDAKKYQYNEMHNIKIGGYDVELYVQDANKTHHSQGIYSVKNNDWVSVPKRRKIDVDDISVKSKFEDLGHRIESAIASGDYEKMLELSTKIREYRQAGLDAHGEFGPENLAFKILRTQGLIKQLYDARNAAKDELLSLDERKKKKKKKSVRYGYGGYWYPGTAYAGQDHPAGAEGGGDGGESVNEVGSTPDGVNPSTTMILSDVAPEISDEEILKDFIEFCVAELEIEQLPVVKLRKDPLWPVIHKTFGRYIDDKKVLEVSWGNRHIMDVLRTVAHELTHKHQHERESVPSDAGETGSRYENEANARAGVLMRDYARLHPDYFAAGQAEKLQDNEVEESLKGKLGAVAAAACIAGSPGCSTTAGALKTAQDVGRTAQTVKNMSRAGVQDELGQELRNFLRAQKGDPGSQNQSQLYKLQKRATQNESASGYIPTKKQAKDPRFSMALTVDIKPGQVGKEANKLKLRTDRQGHPQIARADGLFEELMLEFQLTKEGINAPISKTKDAEQYYKFILAKHKMGRPLTRGEQDYVKMYQMYRQQKLAESVEVLDEVKMSPSALQQWAKSPAAQGIRAGFEAELIFRDTNSGDDDDSDMEPDYDMDERCSSISQVVEFFENDDYGYGLNERQANRLQEGLDEQYMEWMDEQMYSSWSDERDELIKEAWLREKPMSERVHAFLVDGMELSDEEADRIQAVGDKAPKFNSSKEQAAYAEENPDYATYLEAAEGAEEILDEDVEQTIEKEDGFYDEVLDEFRENFYIDDDSSFFSDVGLRWMSDVSSEYDLGWPYLMGSGGNGGSRDWESIGDSLHEAIGMPVKVSSNYHSTPRKEGMWIVEPDSSLSADDREDFGLEIVSPPMPLEQALEKLQEVTDWANNPSEGNAYTNESTGLHMGVSVPFKGGDVDYLKLILFLGDEYVLKSFGREANTYTKSAMSKFRENLKGGRSDPMGVIKLMQHGLLELAYKEIQKGVGEGKYTSAHIQKGYIEFRSAGGDWLAEGDAEPGKLENTMLRYARAMSLAANPGEERREYAKKLYKLVAPEGDGQLALFSQFAAGELTAEQLKKQWAEKTIGTEKKMNQRWKLYQKIDGRWEPVPAAEWNGYSEDQVKNAVWSKYGREALDSGEYKLVNMGEQDWEVYDVNSGATLEIVKGKSKGEVADAVYDKYVDQGIGFNVRPYQDPATMTPRAKLAKRIATKKPEPKQVANQATNERGVPYWEVYEINNDWNVIHTFLSDTAADAKVDGANWLTGIGAEQPDLFAVRPKIKTAQVKDIAPDVAQNFAPQDATDIPRNWEFVNRINGQVIHSMSNASYNQANVVQTNLELRYPDADIYLRSVERPNLGEAIDAISGAGARAPVAAPKLKTQPPVKPIDPAVKLNVKKSQSDPYAQTYKKPVNETLPAKNLNQLYNIKKQLANPALATAEPAAAENPVPAKPAQSRVHAALTDLQRQRDKVQQLINLKQEIETLTARAGRTRYGITPGLDADIEDLYPNPQTEKDMDAAIQGYEIQLKKLADYIARQRKIFPKEDVAENFADGKVKGKSRPGRVKRAGASCNGSVTDLRKRAKNASGEKAKMYHWCANMKSGKKK